jgi:hypothetical protein
LLRVWRKKIGFRYLISFPKIAFAIPKERGCVGKEKGVGTGGAGVWAPRERGLGGDFDGADGAVGGALGCGAQATHVVAAVSQTGVEGVEGRLVHAGSSAENP